MYGCFAAICYMMGKSVETRDEKDFEENKMYFGYAVIGILVVGFVTSTVLNNVGFAISELILLVICVLVYWWVLG